MPDSSPAAATRSGFLPERVVHLHPTRLCNLACLHCYSASGPQHKSALAFETIKRALPLLKAEGYKLLSLSGGEPLTYPHLPHLIDEAHACGLRVSMISNGLFPFKRLDAAAARLDGVAISFDGPAAIHNHLRGRSDAFDRASTALARLADKGRPVSAAISLTREAIPDLPELADHLLHLGAGALQVRPVALAGRARSMQHAPIYSPADQARLYLVVLALQEEFAGQIKVHCDLAPARSMWQQRDVYTALLADCARQCAPGAPARLLADLVNPLVITETGALKPIAYDFNPRFNLGMLDTLSSDALARYKQHDIQPFQSLIGHALLRIEAERGFVDWFDYCTRLGEKEGEPMVLQPRDKGRTFTSKPKNLIKSAHCL